ncbi:hypothetical protein Barb6XT_02439 [Bacteroidales bacterium Barb6XT]|nr:hypothetical protein Barb6XT_02439 [Bacteroidales bacterium Barb6XT]
MKTKNYFLILVLLLLCTSANAQLKVKSDGRVQIGRMDLDEDKYKISTLQLMGKGYLGAGSKITFGDMGRWDYGGMNVFVGEYENGRYTDTNTIKPDDKNEDTDRLWLHGKLGTVFTYNFDKKVMVAASIASDGKFTINNQVKANGLTITSDERLKENIKDLSGSGKDLLKSLKGVKGVSYNLRYTSPSPAIHTLVSDETSEPLTEKEIRNIAEAAEVEKKLAEQAKKKRIGFLAQDIEKVFPELVETDEDGIKSVDYIGMIPVLLEGIKELQAENEALQEQSKYLLSQIHELALLTGSALLPNPHSPFKSSNMSSGDGELENNITGNKPAALHVTNSTAETEVTYELPEHYTNAELFVHNISGMTGTIGFDLNKNKSGVTIPASKLPTGVYAFTLVVDGMQIGEEKVFLER